MPPANKLLGGENYTFERGPDPLGLRDVRMDGDEGVYGHGSSDDSEVQEVTETIEDAAGEGQYLSDYGDSVSDSLTKSGRRTQRAMRKRQKERQTGFNISGRKKLLLLAGAGVVAGGYMMKRR